MVISDEFGFIHIPKTGGRYVAYNLQQNFLCRNIGGAHDPICIYQKEVLLKPVYAFIRHPHTWWQSWYSYHREYQSGVDDITIDQIGRRLLSSDISNFVLCYFDEVEKQAKNKWPVAQAMQALDCGPLTFHFYRNCFLNFKEIMQGGKGIQRCRIGKMETLKNDLYNFFGSEIHLSDEPINVGNYLYKTALSNEAKTLIRHKERVIFKMGHYE